MVGLDCSIIMNPKVWEASGHVGGFSDPMVDLPRSARGGSAPTRSGISSKKATGSSHSSRPAGIASPLRSGRHRKARSSRRADAERNSTETLSRLAERARTQPDEPIEAKTFVQYLATEQYARTGLVLPCPNCGGDLTEPRNFNLMFETHVGAVADEAEQGLPPPRDRPGHLRQLQERRRHRPRQGPVRDRAGRQELPQRDHPAQLHLPLARVRADGDRVLLPPRGVGRRGTSTGATRGSSGTSTTACGATSSGSATTTRTSWRSTRRPRPTSSTASRSASASWRGSRTGATTT